MTIVALKATPMVIDKEDRFVEAIAAIKKRVPIKREEWDTLQSTEREQAFTVSDVTEIRVLQNVLDAMDSAITNGATLEDFKDEIAADLIESWGGEIPGRLETIFRTNAQVAYSEGRYAINSAPAVKEARPYWLWDEVEDDRECDVCAECSGTVRPADDPWWNRHVAPLHFNCRCTITALTPEEASEEGIDTAGPDVEADEGFGAAPSSEGADWQPDLSAFDPDLAAALAERLRS
jgi:SPP1 gp7 family putative phage head morphogenesis protein